MPFAANKTKIVCTIGPSSNSPEVIGALIADGMSVARLNFSHGSHRDHGEMIKTIRASSASADRPVAILQDLCGPKIRVGEIPDPGIRLKPGATFILTSDDVVGDNERVSVSYGGLPRDVKAGDRLLLADGMMELEVQDSAGTEITTHVITGGVLTSHKGVNLPTASMNLETLYPWY